jgi:hypothetical protein
VRIRFENIWYILETNNVPKEYSVAAILLLLFIIIITIIII